MAFISLPLFVRRPSISKRTCTCMSSESVQTAKRALLDATEGLNLGRQIATQPNNLNHIKELIRQLETEWKREKPATILLPGRRELIFTTLPDVLAVDKPRWMQCSSVFHTIEKGENEGRIEQVFGGGPIRFVISFVFELGTLRSLRRRVRFVEVRLGGLLRFNMRKQNAVGSLLVRYWDEELLVLEGHKGSISILKLLKEKS